MTQRLFYILTMVMVTALIFSVFPRMGFPLPENAIGKVVALRGKAVAVQSGSNSRSLSLKSPVYRQDTIKTTRGRIQLMFRDNTLITLGRNTEMILKEYQWASGDPNSRLKTKIKAGSFRVMGGAIARDAPQNFTTEAPAATIGIRGSMYAGLVKDNSLTVVFQGGKGIRVTNPMGSVDIDRPGYGTIVKDAAQAPEKPDKMEETVLEEMEGELAATTQETQEETGTETDQGSDPENQLAGLEMVGTEEVQENINPENIIDDIKTTVDQTIADISNATQTVLPSTGIWTYRGTLQDNDNATIEDSMTLFVNWDNKRFIALEEDPNYPTHISHGFAYGQVTESGEIVNVKVLGTEDYNNTGQIETMAGSETFGLFFGSGQESAAMGIEGVDINVENQTIQRTWSDTMAVTVASKAANPNSGTAAWNGFFTGVGEDMNNPDTDRMAFANDNSSDFKMAVNKDNGTFLGTLSGDDFLGSDNQINLLTLGGNANTSVYVSDDKIAGVLSGSTNTISNGSGSTDLKTHGNFMISSMETQLSDHTNWGYWEIAYKEPGSGKDYHLHVPGAFWIAGEQTPASVVSTIIADAVSTDFIGVYDGFAQGVKFDHSGQMTSLTNGLTHLEIAFKPGASTPVSGSINFTEINLTVGSPGNVTAQGFKGTITGADTGAKVNGTYFGNNAQGIGGNFSATFSGTTTYQGIFAGDR